MRIHFIAIGGSAMHNLAIALKKTGDAVTGSDDEIFEPSKSRLEMHGLLPEKKGWYPEKINKEIEVIILGMHARHDNPELLKALELGLKIYSYPEFLYEKTKNKKRVVIGGSHGKTTVTSMIMHVLKYYSVGFDYMVGANIEGFDTMVNLNPKNDFSVFEGDEYLSSPIDLRPKFHWYKPDIAVITGISWDHINVFPSFEVYLEQFDIFIRSINKGGTLFYFANDNNLEKLAKNNLEINVIPYKEIRYELNEQGYVIIKYDGIDYKLNIFGEHNIQNLSAAMLVCEQLKISGKDFLIAIKDFKGAAKRLQLLASSSDSEIYLDFAHAPSKVKASLKALRDKNKNRKLIACLELHTFSSLQKNFLPEYKNTLKDADTAVVYFNPDVIKQKKMDILDIEYVKSCFVSDVEVITSSERLQKFLIAEKNNNTNLLFMSSGNFNGIDFVKFTKELINKDL